MDGTHMSSSFSNSTATTGIYTLSLHDALPIFNSKATTQWRKTESANGVHLSPLRRDRKSGSAGMPRPSSYAVFCLKKKTQYKQALQSNPRRASVYLSLAKRALKYKQYDLARTY